MIAATILEPDLAGIQAAIHALDQDVDAFEIRFDATRHEVAPSSVRALTKKPLIATCRRQGDGGTYAGSEHDRLALLTRAHQAGFDYVDIEGDTPMGIAEPRLIRSHHLSEPAEGAHDLIREAQNLCQAGAHAKIVAPIRAFTHTLDLLQAARSMRPATYLGPHPFPRALAHVAGSHIVYGGGRTNAPGQVPAAEIRARLRHWGDPAPAAKLLLVVGTPIDHSLSPRIHNAALRATAIDAVCAALDVADEDGLRQLLERASALALTGLSVTAPIKLAAHALAERRTPEAERAGSVNCVRWENGRPVGHNTDGIGARRILERLRRPDDPRPILIVGTGGAARGILAAVPDLPMEVAGRNPEAMDRLAAEFECPMLPLTAAAKRSRDYCIWVNATSVEDPLPPPKEGVALFDLHYGHEPTHWQRHAQRHHLPFVGGKELLLQQAIPAFEFWTDVAAPEAAMRQALEASP